MLFLKAADPCSASDRRSFRGALAAFVQRNYKVTNAVGAGFCCTAAGIETVKPIDPKTTATTKSLFMVPPAEIVNPRPELWLVNSFTNPDRARTDAGKTQTLSAR